MLSGETPMMVDTIGMGTSARNGATRIQTTWEVEKARNQARSSFIGTLGSALSRAVLLSQNAMFYDNPNRINMQADNIAKVTAADVQRAARQYLVKTGRTVVTTVPKPPAAKGSF